MTLSNVLYRRAEHRRLRRTVQRSARCPKPPSSPVEKPEQMGACKQLLSPAFCSVHSLLHRDDDEFASTRRFYLRPPCLSASFSGRVWGNLVSCFYRLFYQPRGLRVGRRRGCGTLQFREPSNCPPLSSCACVANVWVRMVSAGSGPCFLPTIIVH